MYNERMANIHTDLVVVYLFGKAITVVDVVVHWQSAQTRTQTNKLTAI